MIEYRSMQMRSHTRRGFTLVEILVVIVIIFMLSAILFRGAGCVKDHIDRTRASYDLEQLQNALTAYIGEYARYPPVNTIAYEYECSVSNCQSAAFMAWLAAHDDPSDPATFFPDAARGPGAKPLATNADWDLGYRYGLVPALWLRDKGTQVHWYDKDSDRDIRFKGSIHSFLKDLDLTTGYVVHTATPSMAIATVWTNMTVTLLDPWGNEYRYECHPPYKDYKLWSAGKDGIDKTEDDVMKDKANE